MNKMSIMDRKIKKIIKLRNSYPNPKLVNCYLESEKKYKHIKGKDTYAAILSQDNEKMTHNRFFIKGMPRSWDPKHKTYWMIFDFEVQIGDIIEFRGSSKKNAGKKYYIV